MHQRSVRRPDDDNSETLQDALTKPVLDLLDLLAELVVREAAEAAPCRESLPDNRRSRDRQ